MTNLTPYARADAALPPSLYEEYRSTVLRAQRQPRMPIPATPTETTAPAGRRDDGTWWLDIHLAGAGKMVFFDP